MSKRYLGIICLLYSSIFGYVVFFDKLKNFLAPQMQIYIKLSIIPLLLIGIVMLVNNKIHYQFNVSDIVLILPLVFLILAGDGRLTSSFASGRVNNFKVEKKSKIEVSNDYDSIQLLEEEDDKEEELEKEYDFSNVDFDVVDASYSGLSGYFSSASSSVKYVGKTMRVRGLAIKSAEYLPKGFFAVGKYEISCCAADASFVGFFVKGGVDVVENKWYEIEGVLEVGKVSDGYDVMYIKVINIKEISSKDEEQYIYPCYAYDDGLCTEMAKYQLEY